MNIELPDEIPIMTLRNVVLFPQAIMPLLIFEKRYRKMLSEVLASHRIFAIAKEADFTLDLNASEEIPHKIATAGIVRMSSLNDDGTSNVMLQGIIRISIDEIVSETPYRLIRARPISTHLKGSKASIEDCRSTFIKLMATREMLTSPYPPEVKSVFEKLTKLETMADLASFTFCDSPEMKQTLLETLDSHERLSLLNDIFRKEIAALKLNKDLQGELPDEDIDGN